MCLSSFEQHQWYMYNKYIGFTAFVVVGIHVNDIPRFRGIYEELLILTALQYKKKTSLTFVVATSSYGNSTVKIQLLLISQGCVLSSEDNCWWGKYIVYSLSLDDTILKSSVVRVALRFLLVIKIQIKWWTMMERWTMYKTFVKIFTWICPFTINISNELQPCSMRHKAR